MEAWRYQNAVKSDLQEWQSSTWNDKSRRLTAVIFPRWWRSKSNTASTTTYQPSSMHIAWQPQSVTAFSKRLPNLSSIYFILCTPSLSCLTSQSVRWCPVLFEWDQSWSNSSSISRLSLHPYFPSAKCVYLRMTLRNRRSQSIVRLPINVVSHRLHVLARPLLLAPFSHHQYSLSQDLPQ